MRKISLDKKISFVNDYFQFIDSKWIWTISSEFYLYFIHLVLLLLPHAHLAMAPGQGTPFLHLLLLLLDEQLSKSFDDDVCRRIPSTKNSLCRSFSIFQMMGTFLIIRKTEDDRRRIGFGDHLPPSGWWCTPLHLFCKDLASEIVFRLQMFSPVQPLLAQISF